MADGSVTIEVTLKQDQLKKGLNSMKSTINSTIPSASSALSTLSNTFSKLGNIATSAGKACSAVTGVVSGVFTAAATKAYSFIDVYESAMAVFERKLGSETSATEMYNQLLDIAKASKFAQEYIVSAGQTLVGMGVSADDTAKYVQIATNAISAMGGTGTEVEALAEMFGKMSLQTTLYTEDLNQMLTAGIPVYDILAKKYNTTTSAIKEMASNAELTSDDFEYLTEVLNGNVEGMEEFSLAGLALAGKTGTLSGAVDSLNSSFRTFALNLLDIDPRTEEGKESINKLITVINALGELLETLGDKFSFVGDWIRDFIDNIATAEETVDESGESVTTYGGILGDLINKLKSIDSSKLETMASAILKIAAAGPILTAVGKGFSTLSSAFGGLSSGAKTLEKIGSSLSGIPSKISGLGSSLSGLTSKFSSFGKGISSGITSIFPNISNVFSKISSSASSSGSKIGSVFSSAFSKISSLASSSGGKVGSTFSNITSGVKKIGSSFSGMSSSVLSIISKLSSTFLKAFNMTSVVGLVVAGLGLVQSSFGDKISEICSTAMEKGPEIISNLATGITTALPELIEQGSQLVQTLVNVITTNLPAVIEAGISIISTLVSGLAQQLPTLIPMGIQLILTLVTSLLNNLGQLVNAGIDLLTGLTQGIFQSMPMILEEGPEIITNLVNGIVSAIPALAQQGGQLIQTLISAITSSLPTILEAGITIVSSLVSGLAQQLPALIPMALELILTLVTSLLDNIDQVIDAGIDLIVGLAEGLIAAIPTLISYIPTIIEKLIQAIIENLPQILQTGVRLLVELANGLIQAIPQLVAQIPSIISSIKNAFTETDWGALGKQLLEGIMNGFSNIGNTVKNAVKNVGNAIVSGIKDFFGIASPSKLMRDEVGKFLPTGIAVGIEANTDEAVKSVDNMNDSILGEMLMGGVDFTSMYNDLQSAVDLETAKLSTSLSTTATVGKTLTANLTVESSDIYMDTKKVGRAVTPIITRTLKEAGAY